MQACSANQHQVIMPSWLRKNALCLSQSAFSNFALHVINYLTKFGTREFVESRGPGKQFSTHLGVECLCKQNTEKMSLKEDFWS